MMKAITFAILVYGGLTVDTQRRWKPYPTWPQPEPEPEFVPSQTCQEFLSRLVGKWAGGGFFTLRPIASFNTDPNQGVPEGFVDFNEDDMTLAEPALDFLYEELHFWKVDGANLFTGGGTFEGVGYVRDVMRVNVNEDGTIPRDAKGNPIFDQNDIRIHQEDGYYICFNQTQGIQAQKFISIPRGQTILTNGQLDIAASTYTYESHFTDDDYNVVLTEWGTGSAVDQKTYEYLQRIRKGDTSCGTGCEKLTMDQDEYMRLDIKGEGAPKFFHRTRTTLHKISDEELEFFKIE